VLIDVIPFLRCPHCGDGFAFGSASLRCGRGHTFDVARQGYVNLTAGQGRAHPGDSAAMVAARESFLGTGHLARLREAIADTARQVASPASKPSCVIDAGAGTGYYLAGVLDQLQEHIGVALDASRFALRRATRAHPRIGAIGCDVWGRLPLADGCAAILLDVFAPRNGPEFARVLDSHGRLIVVTPTAAHLQELISPLGLISVDPLKSQRLEAELSANFARKGSSRLEQTLVLDEGELMTLVRMGPSARHLQDEELSRRVSRLQAAVAVTVSVTISVYSPL